jgi:hypothetical protein
MGVARWIGCRLVATSVDCDDDGLRTEGGSDLTDERWVGEGGGVDADFIGSGFEDFFSVLGSADAATDGEGDEERLRCAANGVEQGTAALVCGGDIEQDDFVGTLLGVAMGERGWVAGVNEVEELDAFDDASVADV